jgi:hypothetical protein
VPPGTPAGPHGTFDGGYAQVIRATDYPAPPSSRIRPPNPGRLAGPERPVGPASPAGPADADVFVYRDTGGQQDGPAADSPARDPAEHDTAYWYDLLAEDAAPGRAETRGPFEPLVSSGSTPAGPGTAPAGTEPAPAGQASSDDAAQARARKLEQLKDLYLTAEAIGEQNVDKHFDQILARQRELISEYFKRSDTTGPGGPQPGGSGPAVASPRDGTAADAGIAAEQPHGW